MADITTENVPTSDEPGSTSIREYGQPVNATPVEVAKYRTGERIVGLPGMPTTVHQVNTTDGLRNAARERIARINARRQSAEGKSRASTTSAPAADASPSQTADAGSVAADSPAAPAAGAPSPIEQRVTEIASTRGQLDPNTSAEVAADAADNDPDAPPGAEPEKPADAAPAAAAAPAPAATAAEVAELAELRTVVARQRDRLAQLAGEKQSRTKRETDERDARAKAFAAWEEDFYENPAAAFRKLTAATLGVKELKDPKVSGELEDVITDLLSELRDLKLDPAYQANRTATLSDRRGRLYQQRLKARDQAEQSKRTADEQSSQALAYRRDYITPAVADSKKYPHLAMSRELDPHGRAPDQLVHEAIDQGIRAGYIPPDGDGPTWIAKVAEAQERYFKERADKLRTALQPGTVTTSSSPSASGNGGQPAAAKTGKARQAHGSRTITTADASVAPTSTNATAPSDGKPRLRDDAAQRDAAILKNFPPDHPWAKGAARRQAMRQRQR